MAVTPEQAQAMASKATAQIPGIPGAGAPDGEGPGAPTVVPAPAQEPAGEQPASNEMSDFFENLSRDFDGTAPPEPPSAPTQQQPSGPAEVPPYTPPVHKVAEQLPSAQPTEDLPPDPAPGAPVQEEELRLTAEQWKQVQQASAPPEPVQTQQPAVDMAALEQQALDQLVSKDYALPDDIKEGLITAPEEVMPRLAARVHLNVMKSFASQMQQFLPGMVQQMMEQFSRVQNVEREFFDQYPQLNRPEFQQVVQESLKLVRDSNPQADRAQVMRDGAALASVRLRTKLTPQAPAQPVVQPPPSQPPAQVQAPTQPFAPAMGGGGGGEPVVPTAPGEGNIFSELALDPNWD